MLRCVRLSLLLLLPIVTIVAQEQKRPKLARSLADGLVRQRIEIDRIRPPQLASGIELGGGKGPLVLLIRRAGGVIDYEAIERGRGNHGPAPEPVIVDEPAPKKAVDKAPQKPAQKPAALASLHLVRKDGVLFVEADSSKQITKGKVLDKLALTGELKQMLDLRRGTKVASQLLLDIHEDTMMQDVVSVAELALQTGFSNLLFAGKSKQTLKGKDAERLMNVPSEYGFRLEHHGHPGHQIRIADGEVLILLDGPTRWADFAPIYRQCIKAGIWRIGIVGQRDISTRFKLPMNIPFDSGWK